MVKKLMMCKTKKKKKNLFTDQLIYTDKNNLIISFIYLENNVKVINTITENVLLAKSKTHSKHLFADL